MKIDDSMGKCTGWVVAVGRDLPGRDQGSQAIKLKVDPGPYGNLSLSDIMEEFSELAKNKRRERGMGTGRRR